MVIASLDTVGSEGVYIDLETVTRCFARRMLSGFGRSPRGIADDTTKFAVLSLVRD